jgi:hypothetical protein
MNDSADRLAKLVPGFDFLQGLMKNAGAALPGMGQWIAPTLDPEELEKRIAELRTVQFWLEQNARMLGVTIQALEVQRMTLSTLQTMNMPMADLRNALMAHVPASVSAPAAAPPPAPAPAPAPAAAPAPAPAPAPGEPVAAAPGSVVDPMQWWSALTRQFTDLAAGALKDSRTEAAANLAGSMVRQSFDAANQTLQKVVGAPLAPAPKTPRAAAAKKSPHATAAKPGPRAAAAKKTARAAAPRRRG